MHLYSIQITCQWPQRRLIRCVPSFYQDHIMQARTEGDKGWSHNMYLLYGLGPFLDLIAPLNEPWPLIANRWWAWCGCSQRTRSILTLIEQHKQTSWSFHHSNFTPCPRSLVSVQQVYIMWPPLEVILGRQLAIGYVGDASRRIFVAAIACRGVQQIVRGDDCTISQIGRDHQRCGSGLRD